MDADELQSLTRALAENRLHWGHERVQAELQRLRDDRDFRALAQVAESGARFRPHEPTLRRLQAQALIDSGQPATALSVIEGINARLPEDAQEKPELQGLMGRAYKQMFVESGGAIDTAHKGLLRSAISAYETAYRADPQRYWHGVNLLALKSLAHRNGLARGKGDRLRALAMQIKAAAQPDADAGDPWGQATVAEASIAMDDPIATEAAVGRLLGSDRLRAFHVGSLLRQLVQVWNLEQWGPQWRGILSALRAVHAKMPGADPTLLDAREVRLRRADTDELKFQFERILGADGLVTYEWWRTAMQRATGVAAVRDDHDRTIGTAFAVDGGAILQKWAGTTVLLTNFHVVNRQGLAQGLRPDYAELVFEAVDPAHRFGISRILWESPPDQFDCAVLELGSAPPVSGIAPLAKRLPLLAQDPASRVYIIGHPAGRGLEFSIHDNELLDHDEGVNAVTRLHYRAPTEGGSSGSPVFKWGRWEAIAIHHGFTRSKLNGKPGSYEANEGIGLQSLRAKLASVTEGLQVP